MTSLPQPVQNRLRESFQSQLAERPPKRLQRHIVRDYRDDIIGLVRDDGSRLADVIVAVEAQGEVVFAAGLRAEILSQIGTMKDIRANRIKTSVAMTTTVPAQVLADPSDASLSEPALFGDDDHDDDETFRANRSRG